jgi:hypothetical protein
MKDVYKKYLFSKHVLVSETSAGEEKNPLAVLFSLANLFNIKIVKGQKLVQEGMIRFTSECLGENVPEPFYKGFPQSVLKLTKEKLLLDQLIHYVITYGFGNFSEAGHSLFEEVFERAAFNEKTSIMEFSIVSEDEAVELLSKMVNNLLAGTRPLSDEQYALVKSFIEDCDISIESVASKNTCVKLMLDMRDLRFTDFLAMSDVIKLVDEMNYQLYGNTNIKKLNLRNQDRRFITAVIDKLFKTGRCDLRNCFEKKQLWNGLLHHIHYKAKSREAESFLAAMRGDRNESVFSEFEKAMTRNNIRSAVEVLKSGKGSAAVLRNLNYIISRCTSEEDVQFVLDCIDTKNNIVLIQLLIQYAQYKEGRGPRTFSFTKYNMMKFHTETDEELKKRKSDITSKQAASITDRIKAALKTNLGSTLGKVYIDPDMKNYALPIQESASQGGLGVLARGSRIHIPDTKKLRAFTYWEKVDDIDLSCFGLEENGSRQEFSWRTMHDKQSDAITYSGDETSGYNGGSEYFDIVIEKFKSMYPETRYVVFCDNVFTRLPFNRCFCKAGYMTRDIEDSGEIYEPKTVKSAFMINCDSTFAYLYGIDLERNDLIWLNMSRNGSMAVAGTTDMTFLIDYFHVTEVINMYSFFELLAAEVVDDISAAEVIVTDKNVECSEGVELIREYDFERIIALMN